MKKFFALFAMIACFSFASKAQTVNAILVTNGTSFYYLDSIDFGNMNANTNYKFQMYLYLQNNTASTIVAGDTINVSLSFNGNVLGTLPCGISKDLEKDSFNLTGFSLTINSSSLISGDYQNQVCANVTSLYHNGSSNNVTDLGYCGRFSAHVGTTGVAESEINSISIYPNPVRNNLTIENANNVNVNIYAANGQLVKRINNVNGTVSVDMSEMSNGLYFVKMQNENATRVEKIQVIR